ncbi:TetR family transcriptional regulator [Streptomyces mashuensis]|uniref:TetR family transcriptional regulator n=1 Tax=Streptomyces mashuensis TaxID=33904 RepID=A0A919B9Q5_9ACTN|nr:TetR/AcrR family transcriptional regulator [Streptomyces mashuensis]GHF73183.1 TetR family transcriptional regulator [Streptomyces mashuensis]
MTPEPSLRERKKQETRQRISDVATTLIAERGFDQVTVAEIAKAAHVSAMTVFNYFPRKEDLFLDRIPQAAELVTAAVRDRQPGQPPLAAVRRTLLGLVDEGHPLLGLADRYAHFWRIVVESPALRARAREGAEEVENALASALEEAGEPAPALASALMLAACRSAYLAAARRLMAGERAAAVLPDYRAEMEKALGAAEQALGVVQRAS